MTSGVCLVASYAGLLRLDPRRDGDFVRIPPESRVLSLHLVGSPGEWESVQQKLLAVLPKLSRLELLALEVREPSEFTGVFELATYCGSAGVQLRLDYVLTGPLNDEQQISSSIEHIRALRSLALAGAPGIGSPPVLAVLPLRPDTAEALFPLWPRLEREGIPYQISLGELETADERQRYLLCEVLENAAHRGSLAAAGRYDCSAAVDALSAGKTSITDARSLVPDGDDVAQEALQCGQVALPLPRPPMRWRLSRAWRRLRGDKWLLLLSGLLDLLVSLLDGGRAAGHGAARPKSGRALVIGWYGTETAGDKAILGGILQEMYAQEPGLTVTVASMLPFYTRQTLNELGHGSRSEVIPLNHGRIRGLLPGMDEVVIGGGPLMDLVEMFDLVRVLHRARRMGVATIIAGCGIGPVRWVITRWAIRALLDLADRVVLRDQDSRDLLSSWEMDSDRIEVGLDPAINYVASLPLRQHRRPRRRPVLGVAVRDWPKKFGRSLSRREFEARREALPQMWAEVCDGFIRASDGRVKLIPMHTLHIGDDDRWFHSQIRTLAVEREHILQLTSSYSAEQIALEINDCDVLLAMRYHSVLFGVTLGVPTVAIDYTRGGKVAAFGRHALPAELVLDIATADASGIQAALGRALELRPRRQRLDRRSADERLARARLAGQAAAELL